MESDYDQISKRDNGKHLLLRIILITGGAIMAVVIISSIIAPKRGSYEDFRCKTKQITLNGRITRVWGRASYMGIDVSNLNEGISFDVQELIFKRGFSKYHNYEVGDSVYKRANSDTVFVSNGDSLCILKIECSK